MTKLRRLSWRAIVTVAVLVVAAAAVAMPVIRADFLKMAKIKPGSKIASAQCTLCHSQGTKLNPFGLDLQKAMRAEKTRKLTEAVLKRMAKLDSDKDKATNQQEWKADTLPADPKSKPAK